MKRLVYVLTIILFLAGVHAEAQSINRFFARYDHDNRFESVSVGRFLFGLALITGSLSDEEKEIIGNLRQIKVLSSKENLQPEFTKRLMNDLDKVIRNGNFENLVEVRDKGEKVDILVRKKHATYSDLLISVRDKNEINVIWIKGKLTEKLIEKIKIDNNNKMTGLPANINL